MRRLRHLPEPISLFSLHGISILRISQLSTGAYAGIVVLELPEDAMRVNEVLKSFVNNEALRGRLKGRLAIVESWRVRFRLAETSE